MLRKDRTAPVQSDEQVAAFRARTWRRVWRANVSPDRSSRRNIYVASGQVNRSVALARATVSSPPAPPRRVEPSAARGRSRRRRRGRPCGRAGRRARSDCRRAAQFDRQAHLQIDRRDDDVGGAAPPSDAVAPSAIASAPAAPSSVQPPGGPRRRGRRGCGRCASSSTSPSPAASAAAGVISAAPRSTLSGFMCLTNSAT